MMPRDIERVAFRRRRHNLAGRARARRAQSNSYPDGFPAPDGPISISYDRNRDTDGEIMLARFTKADVLAKELTGLKAS
jgi:hypothetical protein